MQHYSSLAQNAVSASVSGLNSAGSQKPVQPKEQQLNPVKVIAMTFGSAFQTHTTRRRYTIDDNGGSYEGL
jgi:hypothetical protein